MAPPLGLLEREVLEWEALLGTDTLKDRLPAP